MANKHYAADSSVWTSGSITVTTKHSLFFGILAAGSAVANAITIKDTAGATKAVFRVNATNHLDVLLPTPLHMAGITVTNGGTASYLVMYVEEAGGHTG